MNTPIRWGILGTGVIAKKFAEGLQSLSDARLTAVGSRSANAAETFGRQFDIARRHASYAALAGDPEVDVIYVATPHQCHKENSSLALNAGKAVLCEKPFTINAAEARAVIEFARQRKLFLMGAMGTRFFPAMTKLRELLRDGTIGEVRFLTADFGFRDDSRGAGRLFDPAYGGGALLDVGVYTVSLASMIFGAPNRISGMANLGATGVDEEATMTLGHANGGMAVLATSLRADTPQEAWITGTTGRIRIHAPFWCPTALTLSRAGQPDEHLTFPLAANGYQYQATAVMECLRSGKLECDVMPLDESLAILRTLDTLRAQWGVKYPMD